MIELQQSKIEYRAPQQWALVLATMPNVDPLINCLELLHVLAYHANITSKGQALVLIERAISNGRAGIRSGTRDQIETLLHACKSCGKSKTDDFRFTMEPV